MLPTCLQIVRKGASGAYLVIHLINPVASILDMEQKLYDVDITITRLTRYLPKATVCACPCSRQCSALPCTWRLPSAASIPALLGLSGRQPLWQCSMELCILLGNRCRLHMRRRCLSHVLYRQLQRDQHIPLRLQTS